MSIPGAASVGSYGQFQYSFPIRVPPGTAGVVPSLSLDYSSQNGNGPEGVGWQLGGLSTITRCPQTMTIDNFHGRVAYTAPNSSTGDRFCLNGQRLMAASASYGLDGTTYTAYVDDFSKTISHGSTGNGPTWFEVHLKSGVVMQFGNTTDSRVVVAAAGGTVREWLLNRVTDTKGNYYTVTYTNDSANGHAYPLRIDYTGSASTGTYSSVQFSYATRTDVTPGYHAGGLLQWTSRLTDIKTYNGAALVTDYQITYRAGTSTLDSRITSLQQCNATGACLAPATIGWQGGVALPAPTGTINNITFGNLFTDGDFNGDGLTDVLTLNNCPASTSAIYYGQSTGGFVASNMTASYQYWAGSSSYRPNSYSGRACFIGFGSLPTILSVVPGDFDGDGYSDLLLYDYQSNSGFTSHYSAVIANNESGALNQLVLFPNSLYPTGIPQLSALGNFDGSGRLGGYYVNSGSGPYSTGLYSSNGDGTFAVSTPFSTINSGDQLISGDFDGDGCTDILTQGTDNNVNYFCSPTSTVPATITTGHFTVTGDFNGDGLTDVLIVPSYPNSATLYLATGSTVAGQAFAPAISIPGSSTWYPYTVVVGDWDGDGNSDIALIAADTSTPNLIYLSTGTGFVKQGNTFTNPGTVAGDIVADWNSDGSDGIWIQSPTNDEIFTFAHTPELVTSINNGIGATTTVAYDRLNKNGSFYNQLSGLDGPYYVVSKLSRSNGIGATRDTTYSYAGVAIEPANPPAAPKPNFTVPLPKVLAFQTITATDVQTGTVTETDYNTGYIASIFTPAAAGLINSQKITSSTSVVLKQLTNTWSVNSMASEPNGSFALVLSNSTLQQTDLDGSALPNVATAYTYDAYNNPLTTTVSTSVGTGPVLTTQTSTATYTNDTTNWILGQINTLNVERSISGSDITRHFSFQHDPSSGLVTQQIAEPSTPSLTLQTNVGYDAFGNQNAVTVSGAGLVSRSSSVTYDANGVFPVAASNALSHATSATFDPDFGGVTSQTDLNGHRSAAFYDTYGRMTLAVGPDGNQNVSTYAYCHGVNGGTAACPTYGAYVVTVTPENSSATQNGAVASTYYDALGRVIASDVQGFNGSKIRVATMYDALGRIQKTSRPYYTAPGTPVWTTYTYDVLARVTQETFPDTTSSTFAYHGLTTSTTNAKSQTNTVLKNDQGLAVSVTDPNSKLTNYGYDAYADLTSVTDSAGNTITNTYDIRGRKTASSDPDMGHWLYGYDGLSELTSQTDAKSQTTSLTYDVLGRLTQRVEPSMTANWVYDTAVRGIGLLASACTGTSCTSPSNSSYFRAQSYDNLSRPSGTALTIGGTTYNYATGYNSDGRVNAVAYPSGFLATTSYTAYGYEKQIVDNATGFAIWTANTRDAELHLTQSTVRGAVVTTQAFDPNTGLLTQKQIGTSSSPSSIDEFDYTHDAIGNVQSRSDNFQGYTENFCYDVLNRLTNYAIGSSCTASGTKTVGYGDTGNIASKTGIGTYNYPASGSALPHAVSSITGTVNGIVNPTYSYDANGNMTGGDGRMIVPTSFNMAASITQGTVSECLTYDSEHNRITQTQTSAICASPGTGAPTTSYLNDPASGAMEEVLSVSGNLYIAFNDFISADGQLVAIRNTPAASGPPVWGTAVWGSFNWKASAAATLIYVASDNLGSTSILTSGSGAVTERDSYDAWGQRRNPNGTDASSCNAISSATTRGYTGQEQVDPVCLVNMNARFYDPVIGRFQSADSIVPDAANGQSFNRFSYVINNPLAFVDPSGFAGCPEDFGDTVFTCAASSLPYVAEIPGLSAGGSIGKSEFTPEKSDQGISGQKDPLCSSPAHPKCDTNGASSSNAYCTVCTVTIPLSNGTTLTATIEDLGSPSSDTNGGWYEPSSISLGVASVLSSAGEYGSGAATIGTNLQLYSSGFRGNQYVATAKIASGAHALGSALTVTSMGLDLYAYNNLPNHGGLTQNELVQNLAIDTATLFTGPIGALVGGAYFATTLFTPDPIAENAHIIQENQSINPSYLPMDPGKISFHPKQAPNAIPDHKKPKKRGDVIDPDHLATNPGKT